jgi:hypothetical protein
MLIPVYKKDIKKIWLGLKQSASKRNIHFDLTIDELNNFTFPITCPIFGMPLVYNRDCPKDNSYSIDRIDSTKGYTIDNIVVISYKANRIKTDATLDELKQIVSFYENLSNL